MASYELTLLIRAVPKVELATILKRTANKLFESGAVIRRIDNLGHRRMPYKTSRHDTPFREAHYFIYEFSAPPTKISTLTEEYNRDIDIIRNRIFKVPTEENHECTIEEELQPPPYRPEVIKLIEKEKLRASRRPKFSYKSGMDYYPFQK